MIHKFTVALFIFAALLNPAHNTRADIVATTTISFNPVTVDGDTFDSLVMDWSTSEMSGVINESALSTLTFSMFNGNSLVYQDIAIQNGVEQPIGGVARGPGDIEFHFDIDAQSLVLVPGGFERSWENDNDVLQNPDAVGTTWNVYTETDGSVAWFNKYNDGSLLAVGSTTYIQSTVFAVPEPASGGVLATVAFGFLVRRRR